MGWTLEVFLQKWGARYFGEHTEVLCNPSGSAELVRNSHFAVSGKSVDSSQTYYSF